ncbi:MAG: DUF2339 domain-containing protein [Hyphomicrobiaceae bacterium]
MIYLFKFLIAALLVAWWIFATPVPSILKLLILGIVFWGWRNWPRLAATFARWISDEDDSGTAAPASRSSSRSNTVTHSSAQSGPANQTQDRSAFGRRSAAHTTGNTNPTARTEAAPKRELEEVFGTTWMVWLGGLALGIGSLQLVRYSIDEGLFGPELRIATGYLLALILVAAGSMLRIRDGERYEQHFSTSDIPSILTSAGTVAAFGTTYAAHALYQFIDGPTTFIILGVVGLATLTAALLHGPMLAGVGLAASLLAPIIVGGATWAPWPISIYVLVVAAAAYALGALRSWSWLTYATAASAFIWPLRLLVLSRVSREWMISAFILDLCLLAMAATALVALRHNAERRESDKPDLAATLLLASYSAVLIGLLIVNNGISLASLTFAAFALAVIASTAGYSLSAAPVMLVAAGFSLASLLVWPSLATSRLVHLPAGDGLLMSQPFAPTMFVVWATIATLMSMAPAILRLSRGLTTDRLVGLYAGTAAALPVLTLAIVHARMRPTWGQMASVLAALLVAAAMTATTLWLWRSAKTKNTSGSEEATALFATAAIAAFALALTFGLSRGYLTIALALTATGVAALAHFSGIARVRGIVSVIGIVVLTRLVLNPSIMGADVGTTPIFNWLLAGYGIPALAFYVAARLLSHDQPQSMSTRLSDGLAIVFLSLLVFFEIRHALHGGNIFAQSIDHIEIGLMVFMGFLLSATLSHAHIGSGNPVFNWAALALSAFTCTFAVLGLGIVTSPLAAGNPVIGSALLNSLMPGYLLPGLAGLAAAYFARKAKRPDAMVFILVLVSEALLMAFALLEVRFIMHGENIALVNRTSHAEIGIMVAVILIAYQALQQLEKALPADSEPDDVVLISTLVTGFIALGLAVFGLGFQVSPLLAYNPVAGSMLSNTLVPGYLIPGAIAALAAWRARPARRPEWDIYVLTLGATALLLSYCIMQTRYVFHGADIRILHGLSHVELGLVLSLTLLAALVHNAIARVRYTDPVLVSVLTLTIVASIMALWLIIAKNPLWSGELVSGSPFTGSLAIAYLLPAVVSVILMFSARGIWPVEYLGVCGAKALVLSMIFVTLAVRQSYHGTDLQLAEGFTSKELWTISVVWLAFGALLLGLGTALGSKSIRIASAIIVAIVIFKVFIIDFAGLRGIWRSFSFLGLGAALIGMSLVYQRMIFAPKSQSN